MGQPVVHFEIGAKDYKKAITALKNTEKKKKEVK